MSVLELALELDCVLFPDSSGRIAPLVHEQNSRSCNQLLWCCIEKEMLSYREVKKHFVFLKATRVTWQSYCGETRIVQNIGKRMRHQCSYVRLCVRRTAHQCSKDVTVVVTVRNCLYWEHCFRCMHTIWARCWTASELQCWGTKVASVW